jgi:peptidyl-prolyl cis-trans isomerase SurA
MIRKILIFVSFVVLAKTTFADVVDKIVAVVNDEIITQSDLSIYKSRLKSDTLVDGMLLMFRDKKTLLGNDKELLNHLIEEKVIDSQVKIKEMSVTIERVEQEIRNVAKKNRIGRADLIATLAKQGIKFSEYQAFIKQMLERQALIEREVSSKIKISDEEVGQYFAQKNGRKQAYEYRLQHVLVSYKNGKAEALEKANSVSKQLAQGSSFSRMVQQYSDDSSSGSDGTLGTFKTGELSKDFEQAVNGLSIGDVSQVVAGPSGYHIFKLVSKTLIPDPALTAQREAIRNEMFSVAYKEQIKGWLQVKRQEAFVRIN